VAVEELELISWIGIRSPEGVERQVGAPNHSSDTLAVVTGGPDYSADAEPMILVLEEVSCRLKAEHDITGAG
jgi:hypothetical protein